MRYYPFIIALLLGSFFLKACNRGPATWFERDDLSLICPKGWEIKEQGPMMDSLGYFLILERKSPTASGLVVINWLKTPVSPEEYLSVGQEELLKDPVLSNMSVRFGAPSACNYAGISAVCSDLEFGLLNPGFEGRLMVFRVGNSTYSIFRQGGSEGTDGLLNRSGFEAIEASFKIKN